MIYDKKYKKNHNEPTHTIKIAHNLIQHYRTKHVEIDCHFMKKNFDCKIIQFSFVTSEDHLADVLTKAVSG